MARDAVEISDSGSEAVTSSKSKSMKTKKAAETPAKDDRSEVEDTDEGDENEEEYEIENIVDSQRSGKVREPCYVSTFHRDCDANSSHICSGQVQILGQMEGVRGKP